MRKATKRYMHARGNILVPGKTGLPEILDKVQTSLSFSMIAPTPRFEI